MPNVKTKIEHSLQKNIRSNSLINGSIISVGGKTTLRIMEPILL